MIGDGHKMTKAELEPIVLAIKKDLVGAKANERKAKERKAKRDAGLVRVEVWVYPQHAQEVRDFAAEITSTVPKRWHKGQLPNDTATT